MKNQKSCIHCGDVVIGRADKKFCSMDCRSNFNNQLNRDKNSVMRNVNRILRKNRCILEQLASTSQDPIQLEKLNSLGFNFSYFTNASQSAAGSIQYCYNLGLMPLGNNVFVIVDEHRTNRQQLTKQKEVAAVINMRSMVSMASDF